MQNKKITIIGAGNLGRSIAKGIVQKNVSQASDITLTKRDTASLDDLLSQGYKVTSSNTEAAAKADVIILCVQPNQLTEVLDELDDVLNEDQLLISVITGISIAQIAGQINKALPIVRAMPNTAIAIGESMTCISSSSKEGLAVCKQLFDVLGKTLIIEEDLMQASTVLGASGIAFFMRYIRAATQGGIQMGFDTDDAQLIAMQTAKGAASLVLENHSHPEVEIDKVTTPQGCTIEGLNEMEHQGFSSALIRGIMTSYNRITKMKSTKDT
ncbi:pyrroline-5-carboxylate reductase [Ekhidna sp.]|uniref:pyrroline-5-carboxylate reductase n=1 Tax=Ekhidna sp. TaxID=2608089 RepID=UPI0032974543